MRKKGRQKSRRRAVRDGSLVLLMCAVGPGVAQVCECPVGQPTCSLVDLYDSNDDSLPSYGGNTIVTCYLLKWLYYFT